MMCQNYFLVDNNFDLLPAAARRRGGAAAGSVWVGGLALGRGLIPIVMAGINELGTWSSKLN